MTSLFVVFQVATKLYYVKPLQELSELVLDCDVWLRIKVLLLIVILVLFVFGALRARFQADYSAIFMVIPFNLFCLLGNHLDFGQN